MWIGNSANIMWMSNPSEYIKARLQESGMNPRTLAKSAGMNYSTLHRILHGQGEPRRSTLKPLARFYKVELDEFFQYQPGNTVNPLEEMEYEEIKEWVLRAFSAEEHADLAAALVQSVAARAKIPK